MRKGLIALGVLFFIIILARNAYADDYKHYITPADTPIYIDTASTTAKVDTDIHEITLPEYYPGKAIAFTGMGYDYIVMTPSEVKHFSFDGTEMIENSFLSVSGISNPVAIAASTYPDVVVADSETVTHYSYATEMVANPFLTINGLNNIISIGTRDYGKAVLSGETLNYYIYDGSEMMQIPALSLNGFSNPLDLALNSDNYDCIVLEPDQAKYYGFTGSELIANPILSITGLSDPKSVATDDGNITIIEGTELKRYVLDSGDLTYTSALSVTSGLNNPTSVAMRAGTHDLLIADGQDIKYYMFDGTEMIYNEALSVQVAEMVTTGLYRKSAVVQSLTIDPGEPVSFLRLRAYHILPPQTKVTWYVTANGIDWTACWRVSGTMAGSVAEITEDNGATWTVLGDAGEVNPLSNNPSLWVEVEEGEEVKWRAELETEDPNVTPKIKAPNPGIDPAIVLNVNHKPEPPILDIPIGCYLTTTPRFEWKYVDVDDDAQSAYQVVIKKLDGTVIHDTGKILSNNEYYDMVTSEDPVQPGPFWESGVSDFILEVKVWDACGLESDWASGEFCILAMERLRVKEIVSAPDEQVLPDPDDPATHIMINPGATINNLPVAKAGTKITVLVDIVSNGWSLNAVFPYLETTATLEGPPTCVSTAGTNRRYEVTFWTEASTEEVPDGTVVKTNLVDSAGATLATPPYADGVVIISDTMYSEWIVVLQGRS